VTVTHASAAGKHDGALPPLLEYETPPSGQDGLMSETAVQVVELRGSNGLGLFLRVGNESRLYRLAPVRDPRQPRFWCLAAFECSSCGIPITGTAIWAGAWGSAQHELAGMLAAIKADAEAWLMADGAALRALLVRPRRPLPLA
jgi:hypothetical protein